MRKKQLNIFDVITPPKKQPVEPAQNHDPALLNFFEDIDNKKTALELDQWRYKHRNRIKDLPTQQIHSIWVSSGEGDFKKSIEEWQRSGGKELSTQETKEIKKIFDGIVSNIIKNMACC